MKAKKNSFEAEYWNGWMSTCSTSFNPNGPLVASTEKNRNQTSAAATTMSCSDLYLQEMSFSPTVICHEMVSGAAIY